MIPTREHRRQDRRGSRRVLALAAGLCSLLALACGRIPGQFEILNNQVPMSAAGGCTIPVQPTVYQGHGTLDALVVRNGLSSAYLVFPLIENNLPASTGSLDHNEIQLTGFTVDISTVGNVPPLIESELSMLAGSSLLHYQVPWSGGVSSGGGHLSAIVEAFPVELAEDLLNTGALGIEPSLNINLKIQALGTTTNGNAMQSDPFNYPISVCAGCLVANVESCPFAAAPANPGNPCNPSQDDPVDCCLSSGVLICPPTVAGK